MICTLSKTLEALDEKLKYLQQNIRDCNDEVKATKKEMADIKRLLNELNTKKKEEKLVSQQGYWYSTK